MNETYANNMTDEYALHDPSTKEENIALFSKVLTNALLFFLIFGISATVNTKDFKHQFTQNMTPVLTGNALQFFFMPFLGFLSIVSFSQLGV